MGRQFKGKNKKNKQTNKSIQNTTQKARHWATRTPLENGGRLRCSISGYGVLAPLVAGLRLVSLAQNLIINSQITNGWDCY
jgi:hypothetical protein